MKIFTSDVSKLCIGSDEATRAYLGSNLVYSATPAHDYSRDYLTFRITGDGTVYWKCNQPGYGAIYASIQYSKNNDEWITLEMTSQNYSDKSFSVVTGDVVRFKGLNDAYATTGNERCCFVDTTATFEVEGNAMSMIYGDNFVGQTSFPAGSGYNFKHLLSFCTGLTTAENLILPATTLNTDCYRLMFYGDTALTHGPDLNVEDIPSGSSCYSMMFRGCTNLNYIKCMATSNNYNEFAFWMYNVQTNSGTFVKNPNMSSWTSGQNGIPNNWTVVDAS